MTNHFYGRLIETINANLDNNFENFTIIRVDVQGVSMMKLQSNHSINLIFQ